MLRTYLEKSRIEVKLSIRVDHYSTKKCFSSFSAVSKSILMSLKVFVMSIFGLIVHGRRLTYHNIGNNYWSGEQVSS